MKNQNLYKLIYKLIKLIVNLKITKKSLTFKIIIKSHKR